MTRKRKLRKTKPNQKTTKRVMHLKKRPALSISLLEWSSILEPQMQDTTGPTLTLREATRRMRMTPIGK